MTYLSPLGYLLGLEGAALLRGLKEGFADRAFVEERIAEIRTLIDTPALAGAPGMDATPDLVDSDELYASWAPHYDGGGNQMIDVEQPVVRRVLDALPIGTALDAACGTGRHAAYLSELGHRVIGVDRSPAMLARARLRLPDAELLEGDLRRLPVDDSSVDVAVCALALVHVPDVEPVLAELARVLRPGGHLVLSDAHPVSGYLAPITPRPGPGGQPALAMDRRRPASEYLTAALTAGFEVRGLEEPIRPTVDLAALDPSAPIPPHGSWALMSRCPEAATAALLHTPVVYVWHFQLRREPGLPSQAAAPTTGT